MPTPASGTISMDNMRDEITRSTGSVSMSEVRTRAGRSGAISFNQMYDCEGWVQTNAQFVSKYVTFYGWRDDTLIYPCGSVTPDESGGQVVIVTGRNILGFSRATSTANTTLDMSGSSIPGYNAGNITRFVAANVSRTFTTSGDISLTAVYAVANTGTTHCMVQF